MMQLLGCDFSSSPTLRKPIVVAWGHLRGSAVVLECLESLTSLSDFEQWLAQPRTWVGGFDLPFGLPRSLVLELGWPQTWEACIRHYTTLDRDDIRAIFSAFCNARPKGAKFAHRACDIPAGSSPSMKWVNPPVAFMLHAGVSRLLDAGIASPGLHQPDVQGNDGVQKVALEAYPGLLARELLKRRSYKSDDRAKQTPERLIARKDLLTGLENGQTRLGLRLKLTHAQRDTLVDDASGDSLDAVLCLVQAAWGLQRYAQGNALYGLPHDLDPLEGWILSA